MNPRRAVIPGLLSQEVDTLRETLILRWMKRELEETKMELQDAKGVELSWASKEASRVVLKMPQHTTSSPAPTILPVQRKLANLADVPLALSLPSEEQYSKCTYPLCFDFSQCPLTQPFHVFVNNHHYLTSSILWLWTVLWPSLQHNLPHFWSHLTWSQALWTYRAAERRRKRWAPLISPLHSGQWSILAHEILMCTGNVHSASLVPTLT